MRALILVVFCAVLLAAPAAAAVPSTGTVGPATPSVAWQGQVYATSAGSCPPQALDPANVVCDHFTLGVQAPGTVTVSITWPDPQDDFDLYVFTAGGTEVASSTAASGTSESVTFAAAAAAYEIRVVPVFLASPSGYSGSATWASAAGAGGGSTCSPATIELSLEPIASVCLGV